MSFIQVRLISRLNTNKEVPKDGLTRLHNSKASVGIIEWNTEKPMYVNKIGYIAHHLYKIGSENERGGLRLKYV